MGRFEQKYENIRMFVCKLSVFGGEIISIYKNRLVFVMIKKQTHTNTYTHTSSEATQFDDGLSYISMYYNNFINEQRSPDDSVWMSSLNLDV